MTRTGPKVPAVAIRPGGRKDLAVANLATRLAFPAASRLVAEDQIGREFLVVLEGEIEMCRDREIIVSR